MAAAASGSSHDLLIVGPGVLGSYLGLLWKEEFPEARVVAQTNSTSSHEKLARLGLTPRTKDAAAGGETFPYVLFAAPPSGSEDYPAEVAAATQLWDGSGNLVFTSSMSVCAVDDGALVTEECPLVPLGKSAGTDRLLGAEAAARQAGGNVLRLVGLYHAGRGPHTFFIRQGSVARYGGYVVNMLHYEDAARMAQAILRGDGAPNGSWRAATFVGCDGAPLTFEEMVAACAASGKFGADVKVEFTGSADSSGGVGKRVDNEASRAALGGWAPLHPSFQAFFAGGAADVYNSDPRFAP